MNIEIVSGSPRKDSVTYRVAVFLQRLLSEKTEHQVNIIDVRQWDLPLLQEQVFTSVDNTPDKYKSLAKRMFAANAFIIVTPEYNGSYTPSLKNVFDHFPKQLHKTFGIVTASTGALGGMRASQQLHLLALALFGIPSPYMLITPYVDKKFNDKAELVEQSFYNSVHTFITEFLWLADRLAAPRVN